MGNNRFNMISWLYNDLLLTAIDRDCASLLDYLLATSYIDEVLSYDNVSTLIFLQRQ